MDLPVQKAVACTPWHKNTPLEQHGRVILLVATQLHFVAGLINNHVNRVPSPPPAFPPHISVSTVVCICSNVCKKQAGQSEGLVVCACRLLLMRLLMFTSDRVNGAFEPLAPSTGGVCGKQNGVFIRGRETRPRRSTVSNRNEKK